MKNITVSVDDETYRLARIKAAETGTSVSALVRNYLAILAKGGPETEESAAAGADRPERTLSEIIAAIHARGGGIDPSENLTRDELYDRNAFR